MRIAVAIAALALAAACAGPLPDAAAGGASATAAAARAPRDALAGSPALLEFHRAGVEAAVGEALVPGNRAELLVDGPATHRAMFEAMARARERIHLQTYILEAEGPGARLAELLARKRAEGVRVRVLYDSVGSLGTPPEYFERLRAAGIEVCEFNPVNPAKAPRGWEINNRNHRKITVVDGRVAFTGGINISGVYSAGSSGSARRAPRRDEGWRDTHVAAHGPIVAEFERLFLADWERERCGAAGTVARAAYGTTRGSWPMQLLAQDPQLEQGETRAALLAAIGRAQRRVWLTYGYFVPDPGSLEALLDASRRGVDVRLVLPGFSDFWAPLYAGRSHYADLLEAGVRIYERRDALLHAKTAVVDGVWATVGSTNLDWRSMVHNYEADLVVLSAGFAGELERLFAADVAASQEITLAAWRERGVLERAREWLARRLEYLL